MLGNGGGDVPKREMSMVREEVPCCRTRVDIKSRALRNMKQTKTLKQETRTRTPRGVRGVWTKSVITLVCLFTSGPPVLHDFYIGSPSNLASGSPRPPPSTGSGRFGHQLASFQDGVKYVIR